MKEIMEIVMKSDEYILGRIHERASLEELELLIKMKLGLKM